MKILSKRRYVLPYFSVDANALGFKKITYKQIVKKNTAQQEETNDDDDV